MSEHEQTKQPGEDGEAERDLALSDEDADQVRGGNIFKAIASGLGDGVEAIKKV
jgi:hypothetical protein